MRQVKRIPSDREYDFGVGITDQFGLLKKAGDFITEEEVEKYQIPEKFLEVKGKEKKNWDSRMPEENIDIIMFNIKVIVLGGDRAERERMVNQFKGEFEDYIREKGGVTLKVHDVKVTKKRKKKE